MNSILRFVLSTMFARALGTFLTIPEMVFTACKEYADMVLDAKEIRALTVQAFPHVNPASILPSDYSAHTYSSLKIFEKVGTSRYRVLPQGEATRRQSVRNLRASLTDAEIIAALQSRKAKSSEAQASAPASDSKPAKKDGK